MSLFLETSSYQLDADEHAATVLDQAGWHGAKALRVPDNVSLVPLPSHSPELNPVERLWLYLRERHLSHRLLDDYDAMTGEVSIYDIEGIPPQLYQQAKKLPNVDVFLTATPNVEFVYFNCGKPQFEDKAVRQALYLAMDRQSLIDTIYYGLPTRTLSYLSDTHWAYNHDLKDAGYDPATAAKMLDEAGWRVGPDGVRQKNGVKLAFTMSTTAGDKARETAQELLQQNFKGINVAMTIRNMPGSVVWGEYWVNSEFDTLMVGWDPPLYPDPDYTDRIASDRVPAKGGSGSNYVQYQNPRIDQLCAAGVSVTDRAARKKIYDQIQTILLEDLPFAPLFSKRQVTGVSGFVRGYQANPYTTCNSWNNNEWSTT